MEREATVSESGIKRRNVVKGAAWAAPVLTVATAAPAMAASPEEPVFPTLDGNNSCKHSNQPPSEQRYHITLNWTNNQDCQTSVTVTGITVTPNSGSPVEMMALPDSTQIAGGATEALVYDSFPTENMANGTATINYTYTTCDQQTVTATAPVVIPSLRPCQSRGIDWPHEG